ncbi:hypothetical protein C0J52_27865 [Blattella germanica]|nr:hypothetical protein C0J52_27865 [Blattella germanica]
MAMTTNWDKTAAIIINRYCENYGIEEVWEAECVSLVPERSKLRLSELPETQVKASHCNIQDNRLQKPVNCRPKRITDICEIVKVTLGDEFCHEQVEAIISLCEMFASVSLEMGSYVNITTNHIHSSK